MTQRALLTEEIQLLVLNLLIDMTANTPSPIACHAVGEVYLQMLITMLAQQPEQRANVESWLKHIKTSLDQTFALHCHNQKGRAH